MRSFQYLKHPAIRAAVLTLLGWPLANAAMAATITPDWATLNQDQPRGTATIAWDIWWGSGDYSKACYELAGTNLGCVARTGASATSLALNAQGNGLGNLSGEASKGLFKIPAANTPNTGSAPARISLYGASGALVDQLAFTMKFATAAAPAAVTPPPTTTTAPAAQAAIQIVPDWNTLNLAQPRASATIAWDIWWGSGDFAKACYRVANRDAGCVTRTGSSQPLSLNASGNGLMVTSGQASKGLFRIPAASVPAAATTTATVTLLNSANVVLADKTFSLKLESTTTGGTTTGSTGTGTGGSSTPTTGTGTATPTPTPAPAPFTLTQATLASTETKLTNTPVIAAIKQAIATVPNDQVEAVVPGRVANPANVLRVERLLPSAGWEFLFPLRAPEYTYTGFLRAIAKFPAVCRTYADSRDSDAICRKAMATMFAHFGQETGAHESWRPEPEWRQGLRWVREMGWTEDMRGGYNSECAPTTWQGQTWPCGKNADGTFKSYFGRGAKQLSYNYNYGPFSMAMYGSVRPLMDRPDLVADTWLNLASAVFFYMYPQPPKPPMMFVVDGTWQPNARDLANGLKPGFGVTTQIINGGVECGGSVEVAQSQNRISYYRSFAAYFGVPIPADEVLGCKGMKQFDEGGAGATPIYWERDDGWYPDRPDGKSFTCKLVGYQTPFSALIPGDYANCVKAQFPTAVIKP